MCLRVCMCVNVTLERFPMNSGSTSMPDWLYKSARIYGEKERAASNLDLAERAVKMKWRAWGQGREQPITALVFGTAHMHTNMGAIASNAVGIMSMCTQEPQTLAYTDAINVYDRIAVTFGLFIFCISSAMPCAVCLASVCGRYIRWCDSDGDVQLWSDSMLLCAYIVLLRIYINIKCFRLITNNNVQWVRSIINAVTGEVGGRIHHYKHQHKLLLNN